MSASKSSAAGAVTDPSKDWSPAEPLRSDATDEQIIGRETFLYCGVDRSEIHCCVAVAREFAAACVAEKDAELVRLQKENAALRVVYAKLEGCPYGHFDKERKFCALGLPGCACADDVMAIEFSEYDTRRNAELVRLRTAYTELQEAVVWLDVHSGHPFTTHVPEGSNHVIFRLKGESLESFLIRLCHDPIGKAFAEVLKRTAARHSSEGTHAAE